jgi:hypothetical protein
MEKAIEKKLKKLKKSKLDYVLRWTATTFGILSALLIGSAVIKYQAWGWFLAFISSSCWFYASVVDLDKPRALMNCFYIIWCLIAVINWIRF